MKQLADRAVVMGACIVLALVAGVPGTATIVWFLVAVTCSGACAAAERGRGAAVLPTAYLLAGCLHPAATVGVPLAAYDLMQALSGRTRWAWGGAAICAAPLLAALRHTPDVVVGAAVLSVFSALLAARTGQEDRARGALHRVRDDLHERVTALQEAQARLEAAQDHETRAAALSERTRIAREIHDGVGHLLTRLLFQMRAAQVSHRDAPDVVADLTQMADTVDDALASMRASVHALADEGEDLAVALNRLANRSGIETVRVDCAPSEPPPVPVARCLVAVTREALTNAARHGRAVNASVTVTDFPGFWRLTVANDGVVPNRNQSRSPTEALEPDLLGAGLGLRSMSDRVESLGGSLRILSHPRFTVLATIPKETA
ncbi:Signal transduction histidine kinase [Actinomyces ruminicola]|uniref:Signal transduction histidine kinase n=1 Tax=Actinomyces ruminicola TaxID=332524 RepID=A0A1G9ZYJ2_9ACTO|nr:histidine kinase [Actinomyces ruminicola]SDN26358.1 Signal transduction histidine kinase [Actinomyces ruminicola]